MARRAKPANKFHYVRCCSFDCDERLVHSGYPRAYLNDLPPGDERPLFATMGDKLPCVVCSQPTDEMKLVWRKT